ncbi:MAG: cellulase family glycosylhydrolase [Prevotella sp.]|nr:cellulase family glycosylhydrolase [Prevotella sp.]
MRKFYRWLMTMALALSVGQAYAQSSFVESHNAQLWRDGKPYYYVGTNFWYGAILGSEGRGGDRKRLCRELDRMKRLGIDNLRILVGSDGEEGVKTKVEPTLQRAPGVYNDTILAGLDYLLMEMQRRKMVAVLYLNNSWEWSGGYGFYLEHAGMGRAPRPNDDGYPAYMNFVEQYATNQKAHELFYDYVRFILGRTNRYTGQRYVDDPTIMSWQIGNEPRAFSKQALPPFKAWLREASALIRSLDSRHLISIGTEGPWGCEGEIESFADICADPNIDYTNVHVWPYNWGWANKDSLIDNVNRACRNSKEYIEQSLEVSRKLGKPLVMEEFGYPRDGFLFSKESSTRGRDTYYKYIFSLIEANARQRGNFAGCNFWGWGGLALPRHEQWMPGDDYTGDPAQEQQGLNSVFASDASTLKIVKQANKALRKMR